jgi:hypothetical protein
VLVIKVDPNSSGRQLLDNATEIIEVARVSRLSQTRVTEVQSSDRSFGIRPERLRFS